MSTVIFSCSPRMNGNSAFCASLIRNAVQDSRIFFPCREFLQTCIACGFCDNKKGLCKFSLQEQDTVDKFYQELFQAEKAIFIAPIYFYHVPATFKAFLDRSQAWFALAQEQKPARNVCVELILLGAREKGDKLFEGAKLSIRYALNSIGAKLEKSLCLYGLDKHDDLAGNFHKQKQVLDFIC